MDGISLRVTEPDEAREVCARLPGLRLTDGYQPAYIASYFFRGLESLEVTW